mmetsp:Transcript_22686/g.74206  ORF Transcript_22686/g.74206 Transcript_22686/m.74206 type:complete len:256 (+) Transcript_22686:223-990(+)
MVLICALVDHRFNGKNVARSHDPQVARRSMMEYVGGGMKNLADSMAEKVLGRREPVTGDIIVDDMAYLVVRNPRTTDGDCRLPTVVRDLEQLLCALIHLPHTEHLAVVAVVTTNVTGDIYVDDVSLHKLPVRVRYPVAYYLVEGSAHAPWEPAVVERGGVRPPLDSLLVDNFVYLRCAHTLLNRLACSIKHLPRYPASLSSTFNLLRRVLVNDPGKHRGDPFGGPILSIVRLLYVLRNVVPRASFPPPKDLREET